MFGLYGVTLMSTLVLGLAYPSVLLPKVSIDELELTSPRPLITSKDSDCFGI